jgi:hypothetical protein
MSIGGVLRYDILSQLHRPQTAEGIRCEVQRLARNGLSPMDIASALRMDLAAVREMLISTPTEAVRARAEAWKR